MFIKFFALALAVTAFPQGETSTDNTTTVENTDSRTVSGVLTTSDGRMVFMRCSGQLDPNTISMPNMPMGTISNPGNNQGNSPFPFPQFGTGQNNRKRQEPFATLSPSASASASPSPSPSASASSSPSPSTTLFTKRQNPQDQNQGGQQIQFRRVSVACEASTRGAVSASTESSSATLTGVITTDNGRPIFIQCTATMPAGSSSSDASTDDATTPQQNNEDALVPIGEIQCEAVVRVDAAGSGN